MSSLSGMLQRAERQFADRPAMVDALGSVTWREHVARVARGAGALAALGLRAGQRFAVLAPNSWRQAEMLHAGYWAGITPVPVNTRLAPPEIADILADADCAAVFVDPACAALLDAPELALWRDRQIAFDAAAHDQRLAGAVPLPPVPRRADDEALLLYTGGTSGRAKGVPLGHGQILSNAMQVGLAWPAADDDIALHVAPMFHSADLVMGAITLRGGAHAYLPRFTPDDFLSAIQTLRITVTMTVPTMLMMTLGSGLVGQFDLSSLRRLLYGASPMGRDWIARVAQALPGVGLTQGYGLTETAPILAMLDAEAHRQALQGIKPERLLSCGRALPGVALDIVADDGCVLGVGLAGEIVARGPNVFNGYLGAAALSAAAFSDAGFRTGDVGMMDADGFVTLLDRRKDVVISGGENVYSGEVEAALASHPDVAEVAVIGVPHATYGEAVLAVVVPRAGSQPTLDDLRAHCRAGIAGYKLPRQLALVAQLPRTAMGKVHKPSLRQTYAAALAPPGQD